MSGFWSRYESLSVGIWPSTAAMAEAAAADVAGELDRAVTANGNANAMFATGNSQLAMLDALTGLSGLPWDRVRIFHMDQYVGLDPDHPASFSRYIRERITERVRPLAAYYVGNAAADAPKYAALLQSFPLDLCVMGIGENGHLAFNDPPVADFSDPLDVKVVSLDEACRRQQVGEGHFPTLAEVPAEAVTVTIPALLRATAVMVICPDGRKAPAVKAALTGPISTACPASVLRRVSHARLYLDANSAAELAPSSPD